MAVKSIIAKDCLPFFKGENADRVISNTDSDEAKILKTFMTSIVPVSILADDSKYADDDSKLAYSPYETTRRVWQAGRYIGSTQIDGYSIKIEPRFGSGWLEFLLADVFHFRLTKTDNETDKASWNGLMRRIFWLLWVHKFTTANQYGLPRRTVKRTHQGFQVLGHVNSRKSISPFLMKRQVVSEYREKEMDDAICRIVYKAYCILVQRDMRKTVVPTQIQDSLNDLYRIYQGHPLSVSSHDYYDISYKSIYMSWKPIVDFSWQIIQQDSLYKHKKVKGESFSLFLDMAEIWEAFLRKQLGERLMGWRVWSPAECNQKIYERTFFRRTIIPDIVLEREGDDGTNEFIVFDAKYKQMNGNKDDLDRSDLFQIHTYIHYFLQTQGRVLLGGLLYPLSTEEFKPELFHSGSLFGADSRGNESIPFIIDGVYCPSLTELDLEASKKVMEPYITAMINRIQERIKNKR